MFRSSFATAVLLVISIWCDRFLGHYVSDTVAYNIERGLIIALLVALASILDSIIRRFYWHEHLKRRRGREAPSLIQDIVSILLVVTALAIGLVWQAGLEFTGIAAASGAFAFVLGIALQPVILDLFGGLSINFEGSYAIGDWLTIHAEGLEKPIYGRVSGITWRSTFLTLEDDTRLMIPNSLATSKPVLNHTRPPAPKRLSVEINLDVRVPADRVIDMLLGEAFKTVRLPGMARTPEPDVIVKTLGNDAAVYEARFYTWPDQITPTTAKSTMLRALQDVLLQNTLPTPVTQVELTQPPNLAFALGEGEIREALSRVRLFRNGLSREQLEALTKRCKPSELVQGSVLMRQGDAASSMFVILEGAASVSIASHGGGAHEVAISATGDVAGEMSLMTGSPRSATVTALTRLRVLEITKDAIEDLLKQTPELLQRFSHVLAKRQHELDEAANRVTDTHAIEGDLMARMKSFFSRAFGI
ncbi:MAG TPA: mechanosensitive ion channel family protein [Rhizomicrobium sp.]|nr:mechanosensitive ion channel family protein [Rhizomicrobium sp.]